MLTRARPKQASGGFFDGNLLAKAPQQRQRETVFDTTVSEPASVICALPPRTPVTLLGACPTDSIRDMVSIASIWWPWGVTIAGSFVMSQVMGIIRARKRLQNVAAAAQELGLSYSPWIGPESAPRFQTALFQNCAGTALKNVMTGKYAGLDVQV